MLNLDEDRFLAIQSGAVAQAAPIRAAVRELQTTGLRNVYFLGAGGAGILMQPAADLITRESTVPCFLAYPAEVVVQGAPNLGAGSLVVLPSLSGTTKEAVEIIDYAHAAGAKVLAMTGHADSPVAQAADYSIVNFAADDTSSESFYVQSLLLAKAVISDDADYDKLVLQLDALPNALLEAKRQFEPRAQELSVHFADHENFHIFTSAGNTWAEAYYFAMCILEEMQWIRTRPVHASDFFHGTLELVEKGVSVIALKGEDATRAVVERVEAFAPQVTDSLVVIDTAEFALDGLDAETRALVSPAVLATVCERLSVYIEHERRHPLTVRRYYRRIAY
ncbi:fructoselysine-6-phosphate deglycase [Propionicimonas paludicola]|uniref:Fructoselysine-6-phosphate deglycase n=1 Tax=Propionicimonas paludicola TaxID=185243 RepID=A0A2A9CNY5_9ACTN|nr:SIS domain-containing protein [Propionicimonas paludicola]PFG15795.1 fructoselysine-6-phosphate deglycase [Propionicimonas paludicola]